MYLPLIFDAVVAAVFVISILSNKKKGLVRASYGIISLILTILLMFVFQDGITNELKNSPFADKTKYSIGEFLNDKLLSDEEEISLGFPGFIEEIVIDKKEIVENAKSEIISEVSQGLTNSVINILSVIILYLIIRVVLYLVLKIVDVVFKLPILKTVNRLGGMLLGVVNALFIVYVLCAALIWLIPQDSSGIISETIEHTCLTRYFYDNNMLLKMFIT